MAPVLEDKLLAQRWSEGTYGVDALLAYSSDAAPASTPSHCRAMFLNSNRAHSGRRGYSGIQVEEAAERAMHAA